VVEGYATSSYGDGFADVYDAWYSQVTDVEACVERLRSLVRPGGAVLELGVGTGRLALPLAAALAGDRGVDGGKAGAGGSVTGIDSSAAMLAELRAKPGHGDLQLVLGDMADLGAADPPIADAPTFDLAFVAYNTLFNLTGAGEAARCIAGVARRLVPGGRFVVEAFVPRPDPDGRRDSVAVSRMATAELVLTATLHDPADQTISGQHVQFTDGGVRLRPWMVRYLTPDQIDAAAGAAGLDLEHRGADWAGSGLDDHSPTHVSVYRRPE